jgi:glycine cleavage system T protein (aminomethyltransferase)
MRLCSDRFLILHGSHSTVPPCTDPRSACTSVRDISYLGMASDSAVDQLRKTPLDATHRALNARMIPYAGWEMPGEYSGIAAEHMSVRTRAGVFDISHMGQIEIAGKDAQTLVQLVSCNDVGAIRVGQAQYSALLTEAGTLVDDVVVYRLAPSHFLLVTNAANTAKDHAWIAGHAKSAGDAAVVDSSSRYALIALQGPAALEVLQPLSTVELRDLRHYAFTYGEIASARALISRTGYTGEDGFEIYIPPAAALKVWQAILASGRSADVLPCGLGARDTLRLEAAMRLYGNDLDESTTLLEAGMGWIAGWNKPAFIGRDRLLEQKQRGPERRLVGFELMEPGIARQGHRVIGADGVHMGVVTSGTQTPFLKKAIGLAYVPTAQAESGTTLTIDVRGRGVRARVVPLPFYRRSGG